MIGESQPLGFEALGKHRIEIRFKIKATPEAPVKSPRKNSPLIDHSSCQPVRRGLVENETRMSPGAADRFQDTSAP
jgi:hypothetical protein